MTTAIASCEYAPLVKPRDELVNADAFVRAYRQHELHDDRPIVEGHDVGLQPPGIAGLIGLSRHEVLQRMVVLMRLLRAEVTESHYQAWRLCAEYADQRWKLRTADGFLPGCAVFFGMLVPPQTQLDPLVRQSVLGPLGFTLLEGILRRASGSHLSEAGIVNVAFAGHERHDHCRSLSDAWFLHAQQLQQQQPKAAGILDELVADLAAELDRWRDDWLRRAFTIPNQVPMLAVVLTLLLFAHMTDDEHYEALALIQPVAIARARG